MCSEKTICKYEEKKSPADYIKSTAKDKEPWISVKEGLPKELTNVMITVLHRNKSRGVYKGFICKGKWLYSESGPIGDKVTAWMKMPEPY